MSGSAKGTAKYYKAIKYRLDQFVSGKPENYIEGDKLFLFTPMSKKDESVIIFSVNCDGQNHEIKLWGSLEIYDGSTQQREKKLYCCFDKNGDGEAFFVDEQGRLPNDEGAQYDLIFQKIFPAYGKWMIEKDKEMIFSKSNWEMTCSCLPFVTSKYRTEIKKLDGVKGTLAKNKKFTEYTYYSVGGGEFFPGFCFVERGTRNVLTREEIQENIDLNKEIEFNNILQLISVHDSFVTPAYIEIDGIARGFAMVSVFEEKGKSKSIIKSIESRLKTGLFQLESPVCCFQKEDYDFVRDELIDKHHYCWPTGYLAGNCKAMVYTMYYKEIEEFCDCFLEHRGLFRKEKKQADKDKKREEDGFDSYLGLLGEKGLTPEEQLYLWEMDQKYQLMTVLQIIMYYLEEIPMEDIPHADGVKHLDKFLLSQFHAIKNHEKLEMIQKLRIKEGLSREQAARKLGISINEVNEYWGPSYSIEVMTSNLNGKIVKVEKKPK